jgi:hypothetical protein
MLQILSTSNETATGTELVQNGDFSELGSDLVTNGDFSAEGINLVDNPNFTDGVEKIVDGDFPLPNNNWTLNSGWTIPVGGSADWATLGSNNPITQSLTFATDKSYKVTFTIANVVGTPVRILIRNQGDVNQDITASWEDFDDGTFTYYFVSSSNNTSINIYGRNDVGDSFSLSNVSVKELGADWDVSGGLEFTNDGAYFNVVGGTFTKCSQSLSYTIGNSYKVSFELTGDGSTKEMKVMDDGGSSGGLNEVIEISTATPTTHTFYFVANANSDSIYFKRNTPSGDYSFTIDNVSVQELGEGWNLGSGWSIGDGVANSNGISGNLSQNTVVTVGKSYQITITVSNYVSGTVEVSAGAQPRGTMTANGTYTFQQVAATNFNFYIISLLFEGSVTAVSVQELDPNGYWTLGTGWSIGADKAISTVTGSNSDITQSILTAGKTYRTVYEIVDYTAGTAQAVVTGSEGADAVAIETYTEDLTTTGTDFSIRSKLGTFDGSVSSVSVKQLGTYEDQSIYVTAADVQTIAQASVYYLVELTSMGSKNSLYFLPSSVVANNGRYTKLNFTVISKDAIQQPTVGIISFYDSAGGLDTYPMGFYEFKIYEQTSSTNLDPTLATGLLEKGFAFVRDFSGNMQELTDDFNEYDPTLTQYVYSK